jgi:hypothetical protein
MVTVIVLHLISVTIDSLAVRVALSVLITVCAKLCKTS